MKNGQAGTGLIRLFCVVLSVGVHLVLIVLPASGIRSRLSEHVPVQLESDALSAFRVLDLHTEQGAGRVKEPDGVSEEKLTDDNASVTPSRGDSRKASLGYHDLVLQRIQQARDYPLVARRRRLEGTVQLRFMLGADGSVHDIIVVATSGFAVLDRAAVATIRSAAPFPPLPSALNRSEIEYSTEIVYSLNQ